MKCCAFGTMRMDIRLYPDPKLLEQHEEINVDEMLLKVGGSVYNTVTALDALGQEAVLYMLNGRDEFAGSIKLNLERQGITYRFCPEDQNDTAASLIFVDSLGQKKMVSYDGVRQDTHILQALKAEIGKKDLFYTSFYEINESNYKDILDVMGKSKISFVDMSPLLYRVPRPVVEAVLKKLNVLSGTEEEYEMLLKLSGLKDYAALMKTYRLKMLCVKRGARGAALYTKDGCVTAEPAERRVSHDTTGCGDTFNAGVICGLTNGLTPQQTVSLAVNMATFVAYHGLDPQKLGQAFRRA